MRRKAISVNRLHAVTWSLAPLLAVCAVSAHAQAFSTTSTSKARGVEFFGVSTPTQTIGPLEASSAASFTNLQLSESSLLPADYSASMITAASSIQLGQLSIQPFGILTQQSKSALIDPMLATDAQTGIHFGAQLSRDFSTDWARLTPYASLHAEHATQSDWVGDFQRTDARYNLGLGFEAAFSEQAKAFMSYETSRSTENDDIDHSVYAGWLFNF